MEAKSIMKALFLFYAIWLVVLASASGIVFFTVPDSLSKAILIMYAVLFSIIAVCISGGIFSVLAYNNIYIVAAVNFLIIFIITLFINNELYGSLLILPSAAALLTLIPALLTMLIKYSSHDLRFLAIAFAAVLVLAACYFAMAFCSTWAYSPFSESYFFKYPIDNTIIIDHSDDYKKSLLLNTNTKEPYTGAAYVYKKQLKIDFTQPKITSLSYYINGRYVGSSVKLGSRVQDLIELNNGYAIEDLPENIAKLIHKNYEKIIKDEIKFWGKYAVLHNVLIDQEYSSYYATIAVYEKEGKNYKSEIRYHVNGVISTIKSYTYDNLYEPDNEYGFDDLGYCSYYNKNGFDKSGFPWNCKDFIYTDKYTDFILVDAAYNEV